MCCLSNDIVNPSPLLSALFPYLPRVDWGHSAKRQKHGSSSGESKENPIGLCSWLSILNFNFWFKWKLIVRKKIFIFFSGGKYIYISETQSPMGQYYIFDSLFHFFFLYILEWAHLHKKIGRVHLHDSWTIVLWRWLICHYRHLESGCKHTTNCINSQNWLFRIICASTIVGYIILSISGQFFKRVKRE